MEKASHPQGLALTEGVPGYARLNLAAGREYPALRSVIRRRMADSITRYAVKAGGSRAEGTGCKAALRQTAFTVNYRYGWAGQQNAAHAAQRLYGDTPIKALALPHILDNH